MPNRVQRQKLLQYYTATYTLSAYLYDIINRSFPYSLQIRICYKLPSSNQQQRESNQNINTNAIENTRKSFNKKIIST